jgi:parallel beta-helix repeat protein
MLSLVLLITLMSAAPLPAVAGDSIRVSINGSNLEMDAPPIVEKGRTLVPLRAVAEGLSADVLWEGAVQRITLTLGDRVVTLTVGGRTALVNGLSRPLDVPPVVHGGRTFVPARFISEAFGASVGYDSASRTVSIDLPPDPLLPPKTFYVSTVGKDTWSGALPEPKADGSDGPFATIGKAQSAIAYLMSKKLVPRAFQVVIRGGTYRLDKTLDFGTWQSGKPDSPITYINYPNETPVISGGRQIAGLRQYDDNVWAVELLDVAAGKWYFDELFINGERRIRARTPNEGYFEAAGALPDIADPKAEQPTWMGGNPRASAGFSYRPGQLANWPDLQGAEVVMLDAPWALSRHEISNVDETTRTVLLKQPAVWPPGWWYPAPFNSTQMPYYVENVRTALDAPGEWYLDRITGTLLYWPLPGEDLGSADVEAPVLRKLVTFGGWTGNEVTDITLKGLSFQYADWEIIPEDDSQSAARCGAAIELMGTRRITLEDVEVTRVGEYAVWASWGAQENTFRRLHLHDLGAGGIKIGTLWLNATDVPADYNTVDNCYIHDGGHVFAAGTGILVQEAKGTTVTHNEVSDLQVLGISVGWTWNRGTGHARDNVISYNHVYDIGHNRLSDSGGIYILSNCPGTVVSNNIVHDIDAADYGGWGLYPDGGSSITFESNIVYDTRDGAYHANCGENNVVRNNIFGFARESEIARGEPDDSVIVNTFDKNIMVVSNGTVLGGQWGTHNYQFDHNLYWNAAGSGLEFGWGRSFTAWQRTGQDLHSIVADPLFVDPAHGNFTLKPDSPAMAGLGFIPIDSSPIGLYGDPAWVCLPAQYGAQCKH